MNLADVMDEVAAQLGTVSGLRVFAWSVGSALPPSALVQFPSEYVYDEAFGRGADRISLGVEVLVGRASDRAARDLLAQYADGTGSASVKTVLEAGTYTTFDSLRVGRAEFATYQLGGTDYLGAAFDIDIFGKGAVS